MAKVTLMDGIQSISGRLGDVCYRTHKNGTVVVSMLPRKRRTRVSEKEQAHRQWFGQVTSRVARILQDPEERARYEKQYRKRHKARQTLRQYIFQQVSKEIGNQIPDTGKQNKKELQ